MVDLIRNMETTIRRQALFERGERLVAGVSGGPDSVALLLGLHRLAERLELEIVVAHADHRLQPEDGPESAAYVIDLAGKLGRPIEIGILEVQRASTNVEQAAREARYRFLVEIAGYHSASAIVVGHTADDQAETLLMRLLRGSGPRGLASMTSLGPIAGVQLLDGQNPAGDSNLRLVRPLLSTTRDQVNGFLRQEGVSARDDRSNADESLTRNRIRRRLVPLLKERFNPRIIETLGRTADLMEETDRFMEARAEEILTDLIVTREGSEHGSQVPAAQSVGIWTPSPPGTDVALDLPRLASYDPILQRYALRAALRRLRGDLRGIGYQHIDAVVGLCAPGGQGNTVELPGGMAAIREQRILTLWQRAPEPAPAIEPQQLEAGGSVQLPDNELTVTARVIDAEEYGNESKNRDPLLAWFDHNKIELPLTIRSRRPGDRMQPLGLAAMKKVKDLMIDAGIPRRSRDAGPDRRRRSRHSVGCRSTTQRPRSGREEHQSGAGGEAIFTDIGTGELTTVPGLGEIEVLISRAQIRERVAELGNTLSEDYADKDPLFVSILKGGIVFLADLMRAVRTPHEIDFLSVSSYGNSTESSGRVRLLHDLSQEVGGRHVVLVEDIVDTGRTLSYLQDYLRLRNAVSIRVCTLIDKEVPGDREVHADYVGFRIPNRFVIGYGMDLAGRYRNLPFVGAIPDELVAEIAERERSATKSTSGS